jgi:hypothetical protein
VTGNQFVELFLCPPDFERPKAGASICRNAITIVSAALVSRVIRLAAPLRASVTGLQVQPVMGRSHEQAKRPSRVTPHWLARMAAAAGKRI